MKSGMEIPKPMRRTIRNHAVEVIGIDYSSPEPMVIINDSGTMDGHAITVPASQFMDAWEDSGYYCVEAYA